LCQEERSPHEYDGEQKKYVQPVTEQAIEAARQSGEKNWDWCLEAGGWD